MVLTVFDWLLIAVLAVPIPLLGIALHRRVQTRSAAGTPRARIEHYGNIILLEWGLFLAALLLWGLSGRSWGSLGLGTPVDLGWWIGNVLSVIVSGLLVLQWLALQRDESKVPPVAGQIETLRDMIPHDPGEQRWFQAVSVSAGICEEILYRGFLLGVLTAIGGPWLGVLLSSLVFGLAHSYQGPVGIAKTAGIGLIMAGLTVLTGSLWAAILLHIVLDVTSGLIAQRVVNVSDGKVAEIEVPAQG